MLTLLPGALMVAESAVFFALEWRLRRASRWRRGALDSASLGVVAGPLAVFLVAAFVLSTAGWDLLRLPGVLTVLALPIALGAALRARLRTRAEHEAAGGDAGRQDGPGRTPALVALLLSVLGLTVLTVAT